MEYSPKQISRLLKKFLEHEIGNKEKLDSIKEKIEKYAYLPNTDEDYIREKHEQLIAVDENERLIQKGLDSIRRLLNAEVGDPERLEELKEIFEGGNLLSKYDDEYLQEKLDDWGKIQNQKPVEKEKVPAEETIENSVPSQVESHTKRPRPTGITILAILYIIGGIGGLIGAISFQAMSSLMGSSMMGAGYLQAMGGGIAAVLGITSIINFIIAWALLSAKGWGRTIVIIFTIISLVMEFVSLMGANVFAIPGIILDLVVLYYMWRPHVIEYFEGKRYNY